MPVHETDICIIGGGITSAMLAEKLPSFARASRSPSSRPADRSSTRRTAAATANARSTYGEHPWHDDYIEDQQADGIISMTMAVGGWRCTGAARATGSPRRTCGSSRCTAWPTDWPIAWDELETLLLRGGAAAQRERRAEPASGGSALGAVSAAGPIPLSYNLQMLKAWAEQSGIKFSPLPMARNLTPFGGRGACCVYDTCGEVCPSGARYSPDFTFRQLIAAEEDRAARSDAGAAAGARRTALDDRRRAGRPSGSAGRSDRVPRAGRSCVASGYCWSSHLLLLSANARFPNGLANRSGLVGRYMNGHTFISARRRTSTIRRSRART